MTESQRDQMGQLEAKMARITQKIKDENERKQAIVDEYLKCSQNAKNDQQQIRVKELFEKKNQKSAHEISKLQVKKYSYN